MKFMKFMMTKSPIFLILLLPVSRPAPASPLTLSTASSSSCSVPHCSFSRNSLASALATFLCLPPEKSNQMTEQNKKLALTQKIEPFINIDRAELEGLKTPALVALVNLVMFNTNNGEDAAIRMTKKEHLEALEEYVTLAFEEVRGVEDLFVKKIFSAKERMVELEEYLLAVVGDGFRSVMEEARPILLIMMGCQAERKARTPKVVRGLVDKYYQMDNYLRRYPAYVALDDWEKSVLESWGVDTSQLP